MMKKFLVLLFALMMMVSLVACIPEDDTPDTTTAGTTDGTTTAGTTTEEPGATVDPNTQILLSALKDYVIVRPETATVGTLDTVYTLQSALEAELGEEYRLTVKTDTIREGFPQFQAQELEILIGDTNRAQTLEYKKTLRSLDYGYTLIDKKLVIYGHSDETIEEAVEMFVDKVVENVKESSGVFYSDAEDARTKTGKYDVNRATLDGTAIRNCVLVYPKGSALGLEIAKNLQTYFMENAGYWVPYQNDEAEKIDGAREILIGNTSREITLPDNMEAGETYIAAKNDVTVLSGFDNVGLCYAAKLLKEDFVNKDGKMVVNYETPVRKKTDDDTISAMTFNIWNDYDADRRNSVIAQIKEYAPDVVGVQEANPSWMIKLKTDLTDYVCVGIGREGEGAGEHSAILYRKNEFNLIETGTKWLSDTPDVVGSKYEESQWLRVMTYAILERKRDGMIFVHVNTHLDFKTAAVKQVEKLIELTEEIAGDYPTIVTGDFNSERGSTVYNTMKNAGYLDSYAVVDRQNITSDGNTFPGNADYAATKVIDFCFIKSDIRCVTRYHVCNEAPTSDHHPVYFEILLQ